VPTLREIREAAASFLGMFHGGTVASATTSSIRDPALEDRFEQLALPAVWAMVDGEARRVTGYDPRTGTITLARPLSVAPAPGTSYGLYWRLHPAAWTEAVNRGLGRCSYVHRLEIAPVAGQEVYPVSFAGEPPVQPHQIEDVLLRRSSGAFVDERPVWFQAEVGQLRLRPVANPPEGAVYVVLVRRFYQPLESESATSDIPLPLARAAAAVEAAWEMLNQAPEAERQALQALYGRAHAEWHIQSRRYIPPPRSHPRWDLPMPELHHWRTALPMD
jgi:hypothetical protein